MEQRSQPLLSEDGTQLVDYKKSVEAQFAYKEDTTTLLDKDEGLKEQKTKL